MSSLNQNCAALLAVVDVPFNAIAAVDLYTVPVGVRCVLDHIKVVAGADAAVSIVSVGQVGALTDFLPNNTLSNLNAQYDMVIMRPNPATTPLISKSYAAGTVIQMNVTTNVGGASNKVMLFGTIYA